jgi:hypothetical protein
MHVGMGMRFAGRRGGGNEKDSGTVGNERVLRAGNGRVLRGGENRNDRTRNDSLPLTALISSRDLGMDGSW